VLSIHSNFIISLPISSGPRDVRILGFIDSRKVRIPI
jgi:hypothetical protein